MIHSTAPDEVRAQEFLLRREFNAPREIVFKAWTEAEHLANWWGPVGFDLHVEQLEFQPGGIFHYRMSTSDGYEMWGKFVYRQITPPERLVYISSFSNSKGETTRAPFSDDFPLEIINTLTFSERNGKTTLTLRGTPVDPTDVEREMFESMFDSMQQGFGGTLDQFAVYLAPIAA